MAEVDTALALHREIGRRFAEAVSTPAHTPRPQVIVANDLERHVDYVNAAKTMIKGAGTDSMPPPPSVDAPVLRGIDARRLVTTAEDPALATVIVDLVELPGRYAFTALRTITWRVGPVAPRVLHLLGVDFTTAWSMNRTGCIRLLSEHGRAELADAYATYYLSAWTAFSSGWTDAEAARTAFAAGIQAIRLGAEIGRAMLAGWSPSSSSSARS